MIVAFSFYALLFDYFDNDNLALDGLCLWWNLYGIFFLSLSKYPGARHMQMLDGIVTSSLSSRSSFPLMSLSEQIAAFEITWENVSFFTDFLGDLNLQGRTDRWYSSFSLARWATFSEQSSNCSESTDCVYSESSRHGVERLLISTSVFRSKHPHCLLPEFFNEFNGQIF